MKNKEFTVKGVGQALGSDISARTIQYWTDHKLLVPDISNPTGRGTTRKYSKKNLLEVLVIKELSKQGLTLAKIKKIMDAFSNRLIQEKWLWNKTEETEFNIREVRFFIIISNNLTTVLPDDIEVKFYIRKSLDKKRHKDILPIDVSYSEGGFFLDIVRLAQKIINI